MLNLTKFQYEKKYRQLYNPINSLLFQNSDKNSNIIEQANEFKEKNIQKPLNKTLYITHKHLHNIKNPVQRNNSEQKQNIVKNENNIVSNTEDIIKLLTKLKKESVERRKVLSSIANAATFQQVDSVNEIAKNLEQKVQLSINQQKNISPIVNGQKSELSELKNILLSHTNMIQNLGKKINQSKPNEAIEIQKYKVVMNKYQDLFNKYKNLYTKQLTVYTKLQNTCVKQKQVTQIAQKALQKQSTESVVKKRSKDDSMSGPKYMEQFRNGRKIRLKTWNNKYLQMHKNGKDVKQSSYAGSWEILTVKRLGPTVIALYGLHKRFLKANKKIIDQSKKIANYNSFPKTWVVERFVIEDVGGGKIALRTSRDTYLRANKNGVIDHSPKVKGATIPKGWAWEHFTPIFIDPPTKPGCYIYKNDSCPKRTLNTQGKWHRDTWGEKYKWAGGNEVVCKKRSVDYNNWCGLKDYKYKFNELKYMEDFTNGRKLRLKLWNNKYIRMMGNGKDVYQGGVGVEEIFTIKRLGTNTIALYGHTGRYLRANRHRIDQSGKRRNYNSYPRKWRWEKFIVEDVGGGKIALRTYHNTYLRAHANGVMDHSPKMKKGNPVPNGWVWEKFMPVFISPNAKSISVEKSISKFLKHIEKFKNGRVL